jgi:hypothetical protein
MNEDVPVRRDSTREKVKNLGRETKTKTKTLLHLHKQHGTLSPEEAAAEELDDNPYQKLSHNPAFEPEQLVARKPSVTKRVAGGLSDGLKLIAHPQNAVKRLAASKVAIKDRPYMSREADKEFLNAHHDLSEARKSASQSNTSDHRDAVIDQHTRVNEIEELRRSRHVAWQTSRHFKRALVMPKREFAVPKKEDYYHVDPKTLQRRLDWMAWLQARQQTAMESFAVNNMSGVDFTGQPEFNKTTVSHIMERILIASSPWQSFFSSIRDLYLWKDPVLTRKWLAAWLLIWYMDCCITFILAYTGIAVLRNRFQGKTVQEMRQSYHRALDRGTAAYKFNEIITQHGADDWLDPVADAALPMVQLQLSDIANLLEALNNFYGWRVPRLTWATLFFFLSAVLLGLFTPTGYSMRVVTMSCICIFFGSCYTAHHHPEYRHVVNPFNYIFWGIPNDAEWSMMYLREKAQETRADLIAKRVQVNWDHDLQHTQETLVESPEVMEKATRGSMVLSGSDYDDDTSSFYSVDSTTSILDGLDILSFRCSAGRLIIFSDGLRFEATSSVSARSKETWRRLWSELVEIEKIEPKIAGLVKTDGIQLAFTDGAHLKLFNVRQRDKAFNCIIGFSGLKYQLVEPESQTGVQHGTFAKDNEEFGFKR